MGGPVAALWKGPGGKEVELGDFLIFHDGIFTIVNVGPATSFSLD